MVNLDEIDHYIIETLRKDGRTPNKVMAEHFAVAESTIAARIRRLYQKKVLLVTLRRDLYSKGYDLQCFADITVVNRNIRSVAKEIAKLDSITSVSLMLGTPEILIMFNAVDRHHVSRVVNEDLGSIKGIAAVEVHLSIDIRKYRSGYTNLSGLLR